MNRSDQQLPNKGNEIKVKNISSHIDNMNESNYKLLEDKDKDI